MVGGAKRHQKARPGKGGEEEGEEEEEGEDMASESVATQSQVGRGEEAPHLGDV